MDVQSQPVIRGQLLAADVALELEEVDVAILSVFVVHRLRRESLVAEIARKNAERCRTITIAPQSEQLPKLKCVVNDDRLMYWRLNCE